MRTLSCITLSLLALSGAMANTDNAPPPAPALDIAVLDSTGKTVHTTKAGPNGVFETGPLRAGEYVVRFSSSKERGLRSAQYALALYVGAKSVTEDAVAGEKLAGAGVAMRISVPEGVKLLGQVANGAAATAEGVRIYKLKIKGGWRYVWTGPQTGSNLPGRWVEDGYVDASKVTRLSKDFIYRMQDEARAGGLQ
ncbi:MAG: hypothetical protein M3032_05540 [Verrucomicrobiota bacterium]|nr:hypothetical protein [Verrucomicrobiota bacterium]